MKLNRDFVPPRNVLEARKRMMTAVRAFFDSRGFLEVETPIAVVSPGLEPHLIAFETIEQGPDHAKTTLYLHTSPEYAMKRMIGRGLGSIYQIARVFRNDERSNTHAPEFTMLEWYRAPGKIADIAADTFALIESIATAVEGPWRPKGRIHKSMSEAFKGAGLVDPLDHPERDALRRALGNLGAHDDTWEDLFFRAFFEHVEPTLSPDHITLLDGYPASMAALAEIDPADPRCALRFEAYVGNLELGNAFQELRDAEEQRRRFEGDLAERAARGRPQYPIDEGLLADLEQMPVTSGIALGLDRLLMCCLGLPCIQDVIPFSPR
ncbi:MAG: EF-P lysine aminoacylase GenX [Deltaproteobacteria bacterium]|nr:EF-P lysine aminoacylase GenX [Deltaproteobacteria bacterium]